MCTCLGHQRGSEANGVGYFGGVRREMGLEEEEEEGEKKIIT